MRNLHNILFFLSLIILTNCTYTPQESTGIIFKNEHKIKHKSYDTELLISYGKITIIDTFLIILSNQHDDFCKVYSIPNNMKEVYKYGHIGNGPNEFLQPMLTYSHNNTFGINELNKQELAILCLDTKDGKISISEQIRLKTPYKMKKGELNPPDFYFSRLDSTHYVSLLCGGKDFFFSLLDSTLNHINHFGESPILEKLPIFASRSRLKGDLTALNGTMVFATSDLPYVASYRIENNKMRKQWSFFYDQSFYEVRNDDVLFSKEKTFGKMIDLKMDDQYIYILYLDQLLSDYDYNKTEKSCANKILVFDYNGNAVAKLHLDCRIKKIAISSDKTKLFGIAQLPDPKIVEFNLPDEL